MADTWRRRRREYGSRKTRDHYARKRWTEDNRGVRLRSLKVDVKDYDENRREERDDAAES